MSVPIVERELSRRVGGAAVVVHRELGLGLMESAYQVCLCYELAQARASHLNGRCPFGLLDIAEKGPNPA